MYMDVVLTEMVLISTGPGIPLYGRRIGNQIWRKNGRAAYIHSCQSIRNDSGSSLRELLFPLLEIRVKDTADVVSESPSEVSK